MPVAESTTPPTDHADLFQDDDSEAWIYDKVTGSGIPLSSLRPCQCGSTSFVFVARGDGRNDHGAYCKACRDADRHRLVRKKDTVYGTLDAETGRLAYTLDADRLRRLAAAIRTGAS